MPVDMTDVRRVLIVKLSSIGDVVHALPVSAALKRAHPHLYLAWAVETACADMVCGNPFLDEIIEVPRHEWKRRRRDPRILGDVARTISEMRRRRFDVAVDLQGLLKSAVLCRLSGAPVRLGYHWQREGSRWLVRAVPRRPQSIHIVDQYLDVAAELGAATDRVEFPLTISDEDHAYAGRLLGELDVAPGEDVVVLNPSAGREYKRWPAANYAELSDRLELDAGVKCIFIGGPGDVELGTEIAGMKRTPMRGVIGRTTLKQVGALLQSSLAHVCGDTGSAHIASAVGTRCVSLFGPTDPTRTGPYGQIDLALTGRRACTLCPSDKCVRRVCISLITVEDVFEATLRVINKRRLASKRPSVEHHAST